MMRPIPILRPIICVPEGHVSIPANRVESALMTIGLMVNTLKAEAAKYDESDPERAAILRDRAEQALQKGLDLRQAFDDELERQRYQDTEVA